VFSDFDPNHNYLFFLCNPRGVCQVSSQDVLKKCDDSGADRDSGCSGPVGRVSNS